jgi:hypothetical protein
MGVTIHFEGQLSSLDNFDKVIDVSKNFAEKNHWKYFQFKEDYKLLERVKDEKDWNYEGSTKGLQLQPDLNSDPLILEFDENLYVQEFCKTQFADISVHILIIDLLKRIEPYFDNLIIEDEGEYLETADINLLQQHIDNCTRVSEEMKKENPKMSGPFRLKNGRIIDLMEDD